MELADIIGRGETTRKVVYVTKKQINPLISKICNILNEQSESERNMMLGAVLAGLLNQTKVSGLSSIAILEATKHALLSK